MTEYITGIIPLKWLKGKHKKEKHIFYSAFQIAVDRHPTYTCTLLCLVLLSISAKTLSLTLQRWLLSALLVFFINQPYWSSTICTAPSHLTSQIWWVRVYSTFLASALNVMDLTLFHPHSFADDVWHYFLFSCKRMKTLTSLYPAECLIST